MKSKKISTDRSLTVAPEVMFGEMPVTVYEQDVRSEGCGNIEHMHSEAQLSLVTEGSVRFVFSGEEVELKKGDVAVINCSRLHMAKPASDIRGTYLCVKFNPAAISGGNEAVHKRYVEPFVNYSSADYAIFRFENNPKISEHIAELAAVYEEQGTAYEIKLSILLQQIWLEIYEALGKSESNVRSTSYSEKLRIDMLCDYIHKNYAEKISLDDIANAAHISKGECCRIFKRLFDTTPFQYLVYYRLTRSIELLTGTDYSISEIAQHVGFCSSSYYTKCFRKEYNCVPHKYRQEIHKYNNPAFNGER